VSLPVRRLISIILELARLSIFAPPLDVLYMYVYRHEIPVQNELSKQNIQDRFFGRSDPVARKLLSGHADKQGLTPPEDESVVRRPFCLNLSPVIHTPLVTGGLDVALLVLFTSIRDRGDHPNARHKVIT
jgi:hypothetical protein